MPSPNDMDHVVYETYTTNESNVNWLGFRTDWVHMVVAKKSFCEMCDKEKKRVTWFNKSFKHPDDNINIYSACKTCLRRVPPL